MNNITLGDWFDGGPATMDLSRLLSARLLLQAGSGFGKSWALRRLLEQTAGAVQQFIIDPEGEFATLREKYDYVIAAVNGGDALAHPRTAGLLLRRLMETGVSAILDISELKKPERRRFVRLFVEEMMQLPRVMWSPVLTVIDESHEFAPEKDEAESLGAIVDLATRGRKRGFALVAATQRIGKLSKDVAAELHNKLIGFTSLDIDVKRAAFELGLTPKDANEQLRALKPGEFYAFGPATSQVVQRLRIGSVKTTHPEPGTKKFRAPPSPTAAIKAVLPKLADLPKEAEEEARTVEDLRRENTKLKRELAAKPGTKTDADIVEARQTGERSSYERGLHEASTKAAQQFTRFCHDQFAPGIRNAIETLQAVLARELPKLKIDARPESPVRSGLPPSRPAVAVRHIDGRAPSPGSIDKPMPRAMLTALAQHPDGLTKGQILVHTGYRSSGPVSKCFADLAREGWTSNGGGRLVITGAGLAALGDFEPLPVGEELRNFLLSGDKVSTMEKAMLRVLFDAYPDSIAKGRILEATGYASSGPVSKAFARLVALGYAVQSGRGELRASEDLFA